MADPLPAENPLGEGGHEGAWHDRPPRYRAWGAAAQGGRKWPSHQRARPTHFVAVRLVSREIQRRVQQLQQWFVAKDPLFERCLVPLKRLHSALLLISVEEGRLQEARDACADAGRSIREFLGGEPVNLVARGIGHFGGRVLFARIRTEPPNLLEAAHHLLSRSFMRHGFPVLDETGQAWLEKGEEPHPFGGHASFLKISKALVHARSEEERRALKALRITEDDFASCKNTSFGTQLCLEFELLSMLGMTSDGYYPRLQLERFHHPCPAPPRSRSAPSAPPGSPQTPAKPSGQLLGAEASLEQALEVAWGSEPQVNSLGVRGCEDGDAPLSKQRRVSPGDGADTAGAARRSAPEGSHAEPVGLERPGGASSSRAASSSSESLDGGRRSPGIQMCADIWCLAQRGLVLRDLLCLALASRDGLDFLRRSVRCVRVVLFSVGGGRSASSWEGSCADWDRRAGDDGDWPLELRYSDLFLCQQAKSTVGAEVGFAEDAQDELLGAGVAHLHDAVRHVMPKCLGPALRIEVDSLRNVGVLSEAALRTLREAKPRVLGIEGLAEDGLGRWLASLPELTHTRVFVHAWTDDISDARDFFARLLGALPADVWALDFQNLALQLEELPVGLLPGSCRAFGTIVLQRDANGCSARGSMAFADFLASFPTFPRHVAIARASLGTEGRWAHHPRVIAEAFRRKFPGLAVLQLELSLKASASINDVPFVELASALIGMGVRVEVTNIRCRAVQYEFLRAALDHAGAVVHQLEDERPSAFPFSHPRCTWSEASLAALRQPETRGGLA